MNTTNLRRISASEINREARQVFRSNFKDIIVLNIVPILMRIIGMFFLVQMYRSWLSGLGISLSDPQAASQKMTEISQSIISNPGSASKYAFTLTPQTSIFVFAAGLFFFLICVGIGYSILDKYRNQNYQIRTIADQFQVFSGKYFFAIIFLAVIFNMIVEAGLAFFFIIGIWFMLIFSQSFYIYKGDADRQERVGLGQTFSTFARSSILVRGYKWTLLWLFVQFFLWEIVNLITREIFSIVLHPYEQTVLAIFYDKVEKAKIEQAKAQATN
ncbi:DUF975 family protein [Companilactobacillus versmoldensis]|uniref:Integral membrane protein n=1 Tax=Companilactobacillus versmoldensis DSM 14857 = KCTC 3814 TaxID=1423815 RepID=A0A0R1SM52_9LACO|nr:DUF975 family protein [Companilactobacillus versmoldensis]KRL66027.1 integral membrane protein [Companilactobacillus versmoldensis DSM 14857 = KCTC 3814]